tara:strand:+ start:272 stop:952 length:681 start_codon:yes stop_codon:yes gene_type:complete
MNIEQKELINIIREELAEVLGMDAEYDRGQLANKVRDLLDEYTGEDLEAAMDTLNAVRAMLAAEMDEYDDLELNEGHGLSKKDADYLKGVADKTDDDELKRILKFINKSNILVDKTKDLSKEKKMDEAVRSIPRKRGLSPNRAINMGVSCAARYLEDAGYDVDLRALAEAVTSAISLREDFFSDSAEEESAEADEEAAETAASASYVTGQGSGVKSESERKYFKLK